MVENVIQMKSGVTTNVGVSAKIKKKHRVCKEDHIWCPAKFSCKNGKYLASIIDDSVIMHDGIIEETKTVPTNFNEKMQTIKQRISILY